MKINDLTQLYSKAKEALDDHFAEQRSNIRLKVGHHYQSRTNKDFQRRIERSGLDSSSKIRITKNHIQSISKTISNSIQSNCPGVGIFPRSESEQQDIKAAQLYRAVWDYIADKPSYKNFKRHIYGDYVDLGEAWVKVFFDKHAGEFKHYEVQYDEEGNQVEDPLKVFSGDIIFERVFGFNVLTDPCAKSWDECKYVIIRKQLPIKDLKARYSGDVEKLKYITDSGDDTYKLFDGVTGNYSDFSKDMVTVKEIYFKSCDEYPEGWFAYFTETGVLEEGTLPLGFPIFYVGFDEVPTSCRAKSIIKQLRPNQIEINRAASQIVHHCITLGDDKVLLQAGSKLTAGNYQHGVRALNYTGVNPVHIQGRTGSQHLEWMQYNISEMYQLANVPEHKEEKPQRNDAYSQLFRSIKEKKKFIIYSDKLEDFLVDVTQFALKNAKAYFTDDMIIPAIGKDEYVNIPEFRNAPDLRHMIKVMPNTDDFESTVGKSLQFTQLLQYAGQSLNPQQVGLLARNMPFLNKEEVFDELTADYDNATSDELALDRGEEVPVNRTDNHEYLLKRLRRRTKKKDFTQLHPFIQQLYHQKITMHEQMLQMLAQEAQAANAGFIPSGGPLVKVHFYVQDHLNPQSQTLVKLPVESLQWLIDRLEKQGITQEMIQTQPVDVQADIGRMMQQKRIPLAG